MAAQGVAVPDIALAVPGRGHFAQWRRSNLDAGVDGATCPVTASASAWRAVAVVSIDRFDSGCFRGYVSQHAQGSGEFLDISDVRIHCRDAGECVRPSLAGDAGVSVVHSRRGDGVLDQSARDEHSVYESGTAEMGLWRKSNRVCGSGSISGGCGARRAIRADSAALTGSERLTVDVIF